MGEGRRSRLVRREASRGSAGAARKRRASRWTAALCFALAAACAGCADDPTRIVVLVDTDLGGADGLSLSVAGSTASALDRTFALSTLERPVRLVLRPADDVGTDVVVSAAALAGETLLLRRTVRAHFVRGATVTLVLVLSDRCLADCGGPECPVESAPAGALPRWRGRPQGVLPAPTCERFGALRDGGADAGPDGDLPDTAPTDGGDGGPDGGDGGPDGGADAGGLCVLGAPPRTDASVMASDDAGCAYPLAHCDMSGADAGALCETDLSLSVDHCGACNAGCGIGVLCDGVACDGMESIVAGTAFAVGRARGRLLAWGRTTDGQRGDGLDGAAPRERFTWVPGLEGVSKVSAGEGHVCVLDVPGRVLCWGNNVTGVSGGADTATDVLAPNRIGTFTGALDVGSGAAHACLVTAAGDVQCWGANDAGQADPTSVGGAFHTARRVVGATDAVRVAGGLGHTCAVLGDGHVTCWGANDSAQLGDGTTEPRSGLVTVRDLEGAVEISAGVAHTCALTGAGDVFCWGANDHGQLGDGSTTGGVRAPEPVYVGVAQIAAAGHDTCTATCDGRVACWGANGSGQLGDGTTTPYFQPRDVPGLAGVRRVAVGGSSFGTGFACALLEGGAIHCWGDNSNGQLGVPTVPRSLTPGPVQGLR